MKVIHENTPIPDAYVDEVEDSLHKATVPLDDLYSDWNDLKEAATFAVTIGHAKDAVVEKGEDIQFDEDGTNYTLALSNKAEESNS